MSVLIKGMEMPKDGCHHMICIYADGTVSTGGRVYIAIPIPPHGDLIDRGYAIATACSGRIRTLPTTEDGEDWIRVDEVRESIKSAPTIIPVDLEKEGET